MKEYSSSTYGNHIAEFYDEMYPAFDQATIKTLAKLSRGGRALELGIGTGRIALPLSQAGVEIHGIDASTAMLAKLQAKPDAENIHTSTGNFADVAVEGLFSLIFIVFNTFFALQDQDEQIRCFKNVAKHLTSDGVFVIEAFIPDMTRYIDRQTVRVTDQDEHRVQLEVSQLELVEQRVRSHHVVLTEDGTRLFPVKIRFAWPSELDLMAKIAGLELRHRWGSWERDRLTDDSGRHISVYGHSG
jgi:SAM-dependent methyltransferase